MQMKRLISIIFLCWLVSISACQNVSSKATATPSSTPIAQPVAITVRPTQALQTPEPIPLAQSNIITKGTPPSIGNAKVSLPKVPGDYIIYWTKHGFLEYASLDGTIKGNLIEGYLISEQEPVVVLPGKKTPRFIFMKEQGEYPILKSASIWMTDVFGNPLGAWSVQANSELVCQYPVFSPYGYWMVIDCFNATHNPLDRYINLVNLESGKASVLNIKCNSGWAPTSGTSSINFNWSLNETQFSYQCSYGEYYFISISGNSAVSRQVGDSSGSLKVWSVSPDWKKIVLDAGYMPQNDAGTTPGLRILVADLDCVLKEPSCTQGATFDVPFALPYDQATKGRTDLQMYWNKAGDSIAWMSSFPTYNNGSFSNMYHSSGWIDLSTDTNQIFERQLVGGTKFLGISPDDKWLLFVGFTDPDAVMPRTLYIVSLKDGTIRHLAEPDENNMADYIGFYGWLTIP